MGTQTLSRTQTPPPSHHYSHPGLWLPLIPTSPPNSTGMLCPLMGSIMRSAVNHSSISLDRLSLPETIYWIPRSKWAFFLFSSVFRELFRGSVCPSVPAGQPLFPPFTHENGFLSLPTSPVPGFPSVHQNFFPPLFGCHTKPTSCFQLLNQGGSGEFYLQNCGGRQGREWGEGRDT
jgi:hypothetical protein